MLLTVCLSLSLPFFSLICQPFPCFRAYSGGFLSLFRLWLPVLTLWPLSFPGLPGFSLSCCGVCFPGSFRRGRLQVFRRVSSFPCSDSLRILASSPFVAVPILILCGFAVFLPVKYPGFEASPLSQLFLLTLPAVPLPGLQAFFLLPLHYKALSGR